MIQKLNNTQKKKGFTLVELIIVLAVMAIIGAIAIPNFAAVRDNAKNKADEQSCATIERTVLMLVADGTIETTEEKYISFTDGKSIDNGAFTKFDVAEIEPAKKALQEVKKPQGKSTDGKEAKVYKVKIDTSGSVSVVTASDTPA
ncbi:type II secretion system protein [Clostridium polynesiense]|uniref:type II secretion system protein n=1 Tax=Clostridium polynesiense TaxID=1325933 RepID=UPI00058F61AE|nr:type II secretion system protein [Clostridium polynesiense]